MSGGLATLGSGANSSALTGPSLALFFLDASMKAYLGSSA